MGAILPAIGSAAVSYGVNKGANALFGSGVKNANPASNDPAAQHAATQAQLLQSLMQQPMPQMQPTQQTTGIDISQLIAALQRMQPPRG